MILHVYEAAIKSNVGEVYVATPDLKIINVNKKFGGNAIQTSQTMKPAQIGFLKYLIKYLKVNQK